MLHWVVYQQHHHKDQAVLFPNVNRVSQLQLFVDIHVSFWFYFLVKLFTWHLNTNKKNNHEYRLDNQSKSGKRSIKKREKLFSDKAVKCVQTLTCVRSLSWH